MLSEVTSDSIQIVQCYSGPTAEDCFVHLLEERKNLEIGYAVLPLLLKIQNTEGKQTNQQAKK